MRENGKEDTDALKKLKSISIPLGSKGLTFFQMRDGIGVKNSNLKNDNKKHASILIGKDGAFGIHSTDERFPPGHAKRNKHISKMFLPVTEQSLSNLGTRLDGLIQREINAMLNPNLHDRKLLSFPIQPSDLAKVITIKGKKGKIDVNKLGQIQVLDPSDLSKCTSRTYFVLKKAKTWWHNEGILFKSPTAEAVFFIPNTLRTEIMSLVVQQSGSAVGQTIKLGAIKYHDRDICALKNAGKRTSKSMPTLAFEAQKKMLLNSATTNMLIWGTGLKEQIMRK